MANLSKEDYLNHLFDIRKKLINFIKQINQGETSYFQEIALKLRILFMKKSRTKPLLETISDFYDFELKVLVQYTTEEKVQKGLIPESLAQHIVMEQLNSAIGWFNYGNKFLNILDAINQEKGITIDGNYFSYKHVIEVVADKMGGAHIDDNIKDTDLLPHNNNLFLGGLNMANRAIYDTAISTIKAIDIINDFIDSGEEDCFIKFKSRTTFPDKNDIGNWQVGLNDLLENFKSKNSEKTLNYLIDNIKILKLFDFERVIWNPLISINTNVKDWGLAQSNEGKWNIIIITDLEPNLIEDIIDKCILLSQEIRQTEYRNEFLNIYKRELSFNLETTIISIKTSFDELQAIYDILNKRNFSFDFLSIEHIVNKINSKLFLLNQSVFSQETVANAIYIEIFKLENTNNFIADLGISSNKNRVSLFVDKNDYLIFRFIDDNGKEFIIQQKINDEILKYNEKLFIHYELGFGVDYIYMVLNINNKLFSHKRAYDTKLNLEYFFGKEGKNLHLVMGSDCYGKEYTNVIFRAFKVFSKSLTLKLINETELDLLNTSKNGLKSQGNQYIVIDKDNHPNFI